MDEHDLDHAWSLLQQVGARRNDQLGPVMVGRDLLIVAWKMLAEANGTENSRTSVVGAVSAFMAGVISPRGTEYQIDGIEFGRCDALMWLGIASGMLVPHHGIVDSDVVQGRPSIIRNSSDPAALAVASYGFESLGEYLKAGRCAEEYAELLRVYGHTFVDQFDRAASLFERAGNSTRAQIAVNRKTDNSYSRQAFFYQEHPTGEVTTIVGSREFVTLRNQIRMG
jgi:hypothetical protein